MDRSEKKTAVNRSAQRAAQALKVIGESGVSLGVSQIAKKLELPTATAYRLLVALEAEGLIDQDPETRKYGISVELFALGRVAMRHAGFGEQVQAELRALADNVGETINLGVIRDYRIVYLQSIESNRALKTGIKVGSKLPAHATAIGKSILAFSPPEQLEEYLKNVTLEAYTPASIVDADVLRKRLRQIRLQRYTFDDQECHIGVRSVGAPVHSKSGHVIGGVAATGPAARLRDEVVTTLVEEVTATAQTISRILGFFEDEEYELDQLLESSTF